MWVRIKEGSKRRINGEKVSRKQEKAIQELKEDNCGFCVVLVPSVLPGCRAPGKQYTMAHTLLQGQ